MTATNHLKELEDRLWNVADNLRANSGLRSSEYSTPVLGLIFLKYADQRFAQTKARLEAEYPGEALDKLAFQAEGVLYLPNEARFSTLLNLPEDADIGKAVNDAMRAIEEENASCATCCPSRTRASPTVRWSACCGH
jgi:type I restriction enzyme M protein